MRIENARLRWQEDGLPYSEQFDDVYFSRQGALDESRHVFLEGNELWQRWQEMADGQSRARQFVIAELGFGCALNFLQTLQLWRQFRADSGSSLRLHYIGLEKHPLGQQDLKRVLALWPELGDASAELLEQYQDHSAGCHRLLFTDDCQLDLYYDDAVASLEGIARHGLARVDAWYVDGFSPAKNPGMWQGRLFRLLASCSRDQASLSSYSVAGAVRRALAAAGFEVQKTPGYGHKRHMLRATLTSRPPRQTDKQPWFLLPPDCEPGPTPVTIIGAGLAGCSLAHSLARRGCPVTILETGATAMAGASGSGQLALRCRLVAEDNATARFYLQAFLFAARQFHALTGRAAFWHPCGVVQLVQAMTDRLQRHDNKLLEKLLSLYSPAIIGDCDAARASQLAGLELKEGGLIFPAGGWINPEGLADAWLDHPNIELRLNSPVATIKQEQGEWLTLDAAGTCLNRSPVLAICASAGIKDWPECAGLPLEKVRGQVSYLPASGISRDLATVICGARTVFPAVNGQHCLAASYDRHDDDLEHRQTDDTANLQLARQLFNQHDTLAGQVTAARTAIRSSTPDRLPLLGPVPDRKKMIEDFGALQRDASLVFDKPGTYIPGLYISAGHGSNGLSSCSLGGEYLASLIVGECPPLDAAAMALVNPVRFLIRDLKKQKPSATG